MGRFSDSVAAMQVLGKHYKLFALSNVDNESFGRTLAGPLKGIKFDSIFTAQMMGLYKPNPNNYHYCLSHIKDDFGIEKDETLIVAQSLDIDHVASTWIAWNLGVTAMGGNYGKLLAAGKIKIGAKFESLGDMASAVERTFQ